MGWFEWKSFRLRLARLILVVFASAQMQAIQMQNNIIVISWEKTGPSSGFFCVLVSSIAAACTRPILVLGRTLCTFFCLANRIRSKWEKNGYHIEAGVPYYFNLIGELCERICMEYLIRSRGKIIQWKLSGFESALANVRMNIERESSFTYVHFLISKWALPTICSQMWHWISI